MATLSPLETYHPQHFRWVVSKNIATVTLDRPSRKNALTFDTYIELRDLFQRLTDMPAVRAIVLTGEGGNFCSGGDVETIIGPLTSMTMPERLAFTRMTGDVVKAMRHCPRPIIAAISGAVAGAGAILAMASDIRYGTASAAISFLFTRVGLAGCDMGACAMLPRLIGQGRATELLLTGRTIDGLEAERWGFLNKICSPDDLLIEAQELARSLAEGPGFALALTKTMLHREWALDLDTALEAEAHAQAICMATEDFKRAYTAFMTKQKPVFVGA